MKILHIGLMVNGRGEGLSAAFKKASTFYAEFKLTSSLPAQIKSLPFNPDIVFLQIQNDQIGKVNATALLSGPLNELRKKGAFIVNWDGDIRNNLAAWKAPFARCCDVTAFSNERDIAKFKAGRAEFLQIGIDPEVFKKWDKINSKSIVFMGNDYGSQFPLGSLRREAVLSLNRRTDFASYGNYKGSSGNLNADPNNPFINQSHESKIYSSCKIAVSISHYKTDRYTSDRLLRCMGSGAFTLVHHYPGIEKDFEIGVHLDTFNDLKEMNEKIDYYMSHDKEREEIAESGYNHVHSNFTYDSMVENIIKLK